MKFRVNLELHFLKIWIRVLEMCTSIYVYLYIVSNFALEIARHVRDCSAYY